MKILIISSFLFAVIIVALSHQHSSAVLAQVQPQCQEWIHRGHVVTPATWGWAYSQAFRVEGTAEDTTAGIDVCNNQRFTSAPSPNSSSVGGYVFMYGSSFNLAFDVFSSVDNNDYFSKFVFATSTDNSSFAEVVVTCNESHATIMPNQLFVNVRNETFGKFYVFHLGVRDLCDIATSAPPATSQAPLTTVPSVPCANINMGGKMVNPNTWGTVYDQLNVPAFPGSQTWFMGDICSINPSFTQAPQYGPPQTGYFMLAPLGSVFNPVAFDRRELDEVNLQGEFIKYRFNSTYTPHTRLLVYIFCKRDMAQLGFVSQDLNFFNNSNGGLDFEVYLGTADVCPVTTTAAPGDCKPFTNTAGEIKHPGAFMPGQGLVKDVMSGESVMLLVDLCQKNHFTAIPSGPSFQPGFVIFYPDGKTSNWPQVSFDILSSEQYLGFANELRMTYHSSMTNHTEDEMIVSVTCGGGRSLTVLNRYVFPRRNQNGGSTYEIQLGTQSMCFSTTRAGTTVAPNTVAPVTSGSPATTLPPPPPTVTNSSNGY